MSTSELSGSWTYRIFNPTFVMGNLTPEEDALIRAEAVLTLRTSATTQRAVGSYSYISGNLEGEYEGGDGVLDLRGTFESGPEIFDYARFEIVGRGRPNTGTDGWETGWRNARGWRGFFLYCAEAGAACRARRVVLTMDFNGFMDLSKLYQQP